MTVHLLFVCAQVVPPLAPIRVSPSPIKTSAAATPRNNVTATTEASSPGTTPAFRRTAHQREMSQVNTIVRHCNRLYF
jgi:hypothetical protein